MPVAFDKTVRARPVSVELALEIGSVDIGVEVVESLDHSRKNVEKFRRRGLVGDLGAIGGNGGVPIRLLLIEQNVVLGPGASEDLEIALPRVRRRMLAGRWQLRDMVNAHVGDRGDVVEEPVIRATAADKE